LFWLLFVLVVILAQSPKVVILAQPESLYWPLPLLLPLFVPTRHSGAARISVLALAVALAPVFRMEPGASAP
jgi:hypothetical protein